MTFSTETSFKPLLANRASGFTLLELIVVVAIVVFVAGLSVPVLSKSKDRSATTVDINNLKQVLVGSILFSSDNNDAMPHSTWGDVPNGPDGWAYATQNRGRVSGIPNSMPSAENRLSNSNQIPFFQLGQLAGFVGNNQRIFDCPLDVLERTSSRKAEWRSRLMKLTSYKLNASVSGFGGVQASNAVTGGTYKITGFAPTDFLVWEGDETSPFNFNDAAGGVSESPSRRHAGKASNNLSTPVNGIAAVGTVGGAAYFEKWLYFNKLRLSGGPKKPNELYCGPGYR